MGRIDLSIEAERPSTKKKGERSSSGIEDDHQVTEPESESNDDHHIAEIYKDIDLFLTAKNGNLDDFERILHRILAAEHASSAVKHGNKDIATYIASCPNVIYKKNINGDTALHLAAKAGDESMARALVLIHGELMEFYSEADGETYTNVLMRAKNERGNTALHEALKHGRKMVSQFLIQEDLELSNYENNKGEFPLYLAAKLGHVDCVASILEFSTDQERINEQYRKKSPIQAAIKNKHRDVLEVMLNMNPGFIKLKDDKWRTPLHYAASIGYLEEVRYLLDRYPPSATQRDKSGLLPIHLASIGGHVDIISLLLQDFPDPAELLDKYGRNILHLAAKNGRCNVVNYILNNHNFEELINMKDNQGNVPLHLATMDWHPKIVNVLTWDNRVNIKLVNDKGWTALDAAEYNMFYNPPFRQRLTWSSLKAVGTPRSPTGKYGNTPKKNYITDFFKERVNTLLLVATLVATITFAAGFTLPGGYNRSGADLGMATMLRDKGFHIFVLCDTIAMFCSIIVVVILIFAQLGDLHLVHTAVRLVLPFLGIALIMMSIAFTARVFLVISKLRWLGAAVLVIGGSFVSVLLILIVTLCMPYTSSNKIFRYLSYYPFCLLVVATGSYTQD
ncbi:hypothetical protein ACJIZ3_007393 [Penstemon smallii]|uniref:PGG domain-containing protein n=1 Tax=Penstemon smallii TaxID=265156 RepID=A0ABD3SAX6_9LAMI